MCDKRPSLSDAQPSRRTCEPGKASTGKPLVISRRTTRHRRGRTQEWWETASASNLPPLPASPLESRPSTRKCGGHIEHLDWLGRGQCHPDENPTVQGSKVALRGARGFLSGPKAFGQPAAITRCRVGWYNDSHLLHRRMHTLSLPQQAVLSGSPSSSDLES